MEVCINRKSSPYSCCCGCPLITGPIIATAFHLTLLVPAVARLDFIGMSVSAVALIPLIAMFIWRETPLWRTFNYLN